MEEQDWLNSSDPQPLLRFLRSRDMATARKRRLFSIACSRRVWAQLDEPARQAINVAKRHVDYFAGDAELEVANASCLSPDDPFGDTTPTATVAYWVTTNSRQDATAAAESALFLLAAAEQEGERRAQANLVREIFGNPFRVPNWSKAADDTEVELIARAIYWGSLYDADQFEDLAAALDRAGWCDDATAHCRTESAHVPGCWVIDRLLGKDV